ncbi:hypothetical protein IGI37_003794 [Enterococcus sp. AZ194]|uniref:DeoR/GlpR family DNA-binding transcription regulator n=1 Tax=Enterococcus sp. AZ194 TaxID=2774629 RepID=UPI003F20D4D0
MRKADIRRQEIIRILSENPIMSVAELAEYLDVTTETIRNDLKSSQLLEKVVQAHGSVALSHTTSSREVPYSFRKEINAKVKRKIAEEACQLIHPQQVIVIEHNSLSVMLVHTLSQYPQLVSGVTIITNSFSIMNYVQENKLPLHVVFLGGEFNLSQENSFGSTTIRQMKELKADIAFMSPGAMNEDLEVMSYKEQDADLQNEIMRNAQKRVLLVEKIKYPSIAMWRVNTAIDYDVIITEIKFSDEQRKILEANKVTILTV